MGMKMMSRKAVFQRSFSMSTAKMSPRNVQTTGAIITHMTLLRMAV